MRDHYGNVYMDRLTTQLIRAVKAAPCSLRALAREAGVSHALLVMILGSERAATPAVAAKVAAALDQWGQRCHQAATQLRRAMTTTRGRS